MHILRNITVAKHIVEFPFMLGFLLGKQNQHYTTLNPQFSITLFLLKDYLLHLSNEKLKTKCSGVSEGVSVGKFKKFTEYMYCTQIFSEATVRWDYCCLY
jgi:hypothetical protein